MRLSCFSERFDHLDAGHELDHRRGHLRKMPVHLGGFRSHILHRERLQQEIEGDRGDADERQAPIDPEHESQKNHRLQNAVKTVDRSVCDDGVDRLRVILHSASDLAGFRSAKPSKRRAAQPLNDTLANDVAQFHIGKMRDDERKSAKEQLREERHDEEEGNFVHLGGIGLRERAFPRQK